MDREYDRGLPLHVGRRERPATGARAGPAAAGRRRAHFELARGLLAAAGVGRRPSGSLRRDGLLRRGARQGAG